MVRALNPSARRQRQVDLEFETARATLRETMSQKKQKMEHLCWSVVAHAFYLSTWGTKVQS